MKSRPVMGWALHDGMITAKRHLIQIPRIPELMFFSLIQPVIFVLLFAFVFGGAIPVPGADPGAGADAYREYLMPGIFGQTVTFAAAGATVGLAEDMHKGIIDRFRSLPMANSAVLTGRTVADLVRMVAVLGVLSLTGLAVGWRIHNGIPKAAMAYGLLLLFAFAISWVGCWIGLHMPNPETANTAGLAWLFPLSFLSVAFVPLQGLPTWLQPIAAWNPISSLVLACRELFGNPTGAPGDFLPQRYPVLFSLLWSLAILAVFVPLSVRYFKRATAR